MQSQQLSFHTYQKKHGRKVFQANRKFQHKMLDRHFQFSTENRKTRKFICSFACFAPSGDVLLFETFISTFHWSMPDVVLKRFSLFHMVQYSWAFSIIYYEWCGNFISYFKLAIAHLIIVKTELLWKKKMVILQNTSMKLKIENA